MTGKSLNSLGDEVTDAVDVVLLSVSVAEGNVEFVMCSGYGHVSCRVISSVEICRGRGGARELEEPLQPGASLAGGCQLGASREGLSPELSPASLTSDACLSVFQTDQQ